MRVVRLLLRDDPQAVRLVSASRCCGSCCVATRSRRRSCSGAFAADAAASVRAARGGRARVGGRAGGALRLAELSFVERGPPAPVTKLVLASNHRWRVSEGALRGRVVARFVRVSGSLTLLDLGLNNIGDKGAKEIADAVAASGSLAHLNLNVNNIGDEGAKALAAAAAASGSLATLDLQNNNIEPLAPKRSMRSAPVLARTCGSTATRSATRARRPWRPVWPPAAGEAARRQQHRRCRGQGASWRHRAAAVGGARPRQQQDRAAGAVPPDATAPAARWRSSS